MTKVYAGGATGAGAYCLRTSLSFSLYSYARTSFILLSLLSCLNVRRVLRRSLAPG